MIQPRNVAAFAEHMDNIKNYDSVYSKSNVQTEHHYEINQVNEGEIFPKRSLMQMERASNDTNQALLFHQRQAS